MSSQALIIDDERDICELVEMALTAQEIVCDSVYSVKSAIKQLKEKAYDVIFCDVRLPDGDGLELLLHINKHYPDTPVCIMTAHGNMDMAIKALKMGAFDFINKPFELKQLRSVCAAALKAGKKYKPQEAAKPSAAAKTHAAKTAAKAAEPDASNDGGRRQTHLIGESPQMVEVREMITRVARSQATIFIHGESGTGKEVAARAIHEQSSRSEGPFIAVNCGAIPENLVESEFFGYKKGAFTGANQDTDGLFVAASGGTLFLDEVADLPLPMQVKLLRAIQERAVRPIGSDREESIDTRIISATNHNLAEKVKKGEFREDLYYRLNVIGIDLPPLREREGDIALLAHFLLARLARNAGYPEAQFSPAAFEKLCAYHFPGNVRELENVLERALTFMNDNTIEAEDIRLSTALHQQDSAESDNEAKFHFSFDDFAQSIDNSKPEKAAAAPSKPEAPSKGNSAFWEPASEQAAETFGEDNHLQDMFIPNDLEQYMEDLERQLLVKALEEAGNNKTRAAENLGISFRAMRYKLKKLGIE